MNFNLKAVGKYCGYAMVLGASLSIIALIIVVSQSGYGRPSLVCSVFVYLAYWPLLLSGRTAQNLFVSFWMIPVNVIGWGVAGCLLGLLRSMLK